MDVEKLLFDSLFTRKTTINDLIRQKQYDVQSTIASFRLDNIADLDDDQTVNRFVTEYTLQLPMLQVEGMSILDQTNRQGQNRVVVVPFTGNATLFGWTPSQYTYNPPRTDIVGRQLHMHIPSNTADAQQMRQAIDSRIQTIEQWLGWMRESVEPYNHNLQALVKAGLAARKQQVETEQRLANDLGLPVQKQQ